MRESADNRGFISIELRDVIVIIVLALVVYIMVEQTVRVYLFGANAFSYTKMSSMKSTRGSLVLRESDIESINHELLPGLDTFFKQASLKTNSRGLRDKEYPLEKSPNTYRIAVVGGSFTMGSGLEIEDTFHGLLESRLNEESTGTEYEFLNYGVAGYKINNKLAVIEHKVLEYNPDLVLFILDGSQITIRKNRGLTPKADRFSFFKSYSYKLMRNVRIFNRNDPDKLKYLNNRLSKIGQLYSALVELDEFSKSYDIPVMVIVLDHNYDHYELSKFIEKAVKESGLYFSNTLPAFEDTNISDYEIYKIDYHPNKDANKIFADVIYGDLIEHKLIGGSRDKVESGN